MNLLDNENCAGVYSRNNVTPVQDSNGYPCRLGPRFAFIISASALLLLLRCIDPVVAGSWLPVHPSCGAITGLPCIFCGMTRSLHLLLNGDFIGAIYFNWLAFPFIGAIIFLLALFTIEIAKRRAIWRLNMSLRVKRSRLTVFGLSLLLLWTLQTYLAVSQHKHELFNPHGPLYSVFVR
jgi:phosphate/sulfate permease